MKERDRQEFFNLPSICFSCITEDNLFFFAQAKTDEFSVIYIHTQLLDTSNTRNLLHHNIFWQAEYIKIEY